MFLIVSVRSTEGAARLIVVAEAVGVICISESAQLPSAGSVTLVLVPVCPPPAGAPVVAAPTPGCCDWTWAGSGSDGPFPAGGLSTKVGSSSGEALPAGAGVGSEDEE